MKWEEILKNPPPLVIIFLLIFFGATLTTSPDQTTKYFSYGMLAIGVILGIVEFFNYRDREHIKKLNESFNNIIKQLQKSLDSLTKVNNSNRNVLKGDKTDIDQGTKGVGYSNLVPNSEITPTTL